MISSALSITTTLSSSPIHRFSRFNATPTSTSALYLSLNQRVRDRTVCHVELSGDAPFAAAIGACVFSSLLFPAAGGEEAGGDGGRADSALDSDDSRLIVMSVISFIPYFNWLSWIFAWLDTGKSRYAVYSLVYLLPYIRSNLSLSTEESWLPIASIILCVLHVQLETSIKNGDIQGFQLFRETKISRPNFEEKRDLPSADEHEIDGWGDLHDGKPSNEGNKKNKR